MPEQGLWPTDLTAKREPPSEPSPREILEFQARDLAEKTKGVLRGRVEPGSHGEFVTLDFLIIAPALEDYEYRLFKVQHRLMPQYPVTIILDADQRESRSDADFRTELASVFASESTRRTIRELLDLSEQREGKDKPARRRRTG